MRAQEVSDDERLPAQGTPLLQGIAFLAITTAAITSTFVAGATNERGSARAADERPIAAATTMSAPGKRGIDAAKHEEDRERDRGEDCRGAADTAELAHDLPELR